MRRANALVAVGVVLVLVGIGLAWLVGRDDGGDEPTGRTAVLVAVSDLEPGQAGDDLVASGQVRVEQVAVAEAEAGALASTDDLAGTIVATTVPEGEQVLGTAVRSSALRGESFEIPEGQEAIAVTVPFSAGGAGYVAPGDRVNVYASILPGTQGAPTSPRTELLLHGIEVLDVSNELAPRRAEAAVPTDGAPTTQAARGGAGDITLLLALNAEQAEEVIFASTNNQLWTTLVPEDAVTPTPPGTDYRTYGPADDR